MALMELANLTLRTPEGEGPVARILAQMPDPMRPDLPALLFVMALLGVLYLYLRVVFFRPIEKVMADRDRDLASGGDAKAQAAAALDTRQKDYQARLKDLRAGAFETRKALADAALHAKQQLLEEARAQALTERTAAVAALKAQKVEAEQTLRAQAEALSESMAQTLLKQA